MCGKFTQTASRPASLGYEDFRAAGAGPVEAVTPMRLARVLRMNEDGARELVAMRWGASRAGEAASGRPDYIHARAETVDIRPTFRDGFLHRRGLVVAMSFNIADKQGGRPVQYASSPRDGGPIGLAVLWRAERDAAGRPFPSFVMISTEPNASVETVADRMPAVIGPEDWARWLGEASATPDALKRLLKPAGGDWVIERAHKPALAPARDQPGLFGSFG